nr:hypothetical protein RVX_3300 [Nitratidesulfovibrio sp. HK-II]
MADVLVVPHPRFGVDGFAHRTKNAQRGQVVLLRPVRAFAHQGADDRGRGVEDVDPELFHDVPEPVRPRPRGHALEHQRGAAKGQRAVHDVAVPGDPADVGGAPVHVVVMQVEHPLGGVGRVGKVAAGGVHHALGLAGGTAGVQDEQHVLAVHLGARAGGIKGAVGHHLVPPQVAAFAHGAARVRAVDHHHLFHAGAVLQGLVHVDLERDGPARAQHGVRRDHHPGLAVLDAVLQADGREPGENYGMHRPDARAGQHGHGQLGNHGHVQRNAVALLHAKVAQHGRKPAHLVVEHLVGQHAHVVFRLALPDDGGLVAAAVDQMAVQAVVRHVQLRAREPFDARGVHVRVHHLVPRGEPVQQLLCPVAPEAFGVLVGAFAVGEVFVHAVHVRAAAITGRRGGRREVALFVHHAFDLVGLVLAHGRCLPFVWRYAGVPVFSWRPCPFLRRGVAHGPCLAPCSDHAKGRATPFSVNGHPAPVKLTFCRWTERMP